MAGILGLIVGKAVTGISNLVRNAKAGKDALAQGFLPQGNRSVSVSTSGTATQPGAAVEWYKQPWVIPAGIVAGLLLLWALIKSLKK